MSVDALYDARWASNDELVLETILPKWTPTRLFLTVFEDGATDRLRGDSEVFRAFETDLHCTDWIEGPWNEEVLTKNHELVWARDVTYSRTITNPLVGQRVSNATERQVFRRTSSGGMGWTITRRIQTGSTIPFADSFDVLVLFAASSLGRDCRIRVHATVLPTSKASFGFKLTTLPILRINVKAEIQRDMQQLLKAIQTP